MSWSLSIVSFVSDYLWLFLLYQVLWCWFIWLCTFFLHCCSFYFSLSMKEVPFEGDQAKFFLAMALPPSVVTFTWSHLFTFPSRRSSGMTLYPLRTSGIMVICLSGFVFVLEFVSVLSLLGGCTHVKGMMFWELPFWLRMEYRWCFSPLSYYSLSNSMGNFYVAFDVHFMCGGGLRLSYLQFCQENGSSLWIST